jgi:hypothetical protein
MTRGLVCLAAAVAAACASGGGSGATAAATPAAPTPVATPTPPAPPRAPDELVRYGPSALRYRVQRRLHIQQALGGQPQSQDLGAQIFVAAIITGPIDSVGYRATFTVDSIVADSGTPPAVAATVTRARRLAYAGRIDARGEFRNPVASDTTLAQSLIQLLGNFRDFLPRLPTEGLKLGADWTDTLSGTQRAGSATVSRRAIVHTAAPVWEDRGGIRSLRLDIAATYTVEGSGEGGGQPFELGGTGSVSGVGFVAADGRYLGGESRDSSSITVRFPFQGLGIPVIQVTRSSVAVLP